MINTPYFNTYLTTKISLSPDQLDNNLSKNIKTNLVKKMEGKRCEYGYIVKVYKVIEYKGGDIMFEDPTSSVIYTVKFSCKLCKPLNNTTIVCKIVDINKSIINLINGPIQVIILDNHGGINHDKFIFDDKNNRYIAILDNNKGKPLTPNTYVNVKIISSVVELKRIVSIGALIGLSTQDEIDNALLMERDDNIDFVEYENYIKQNESPLIPEPDIKIDTQGDIEEEDKIYEDDE